MSLFSVETLAFKVCWRKEWVVVRYLKGRAQVFSGSSSRRLFTVVSVVAYFAHFSQLTSILVNQGCKLRLFGCRVEIILFFYVDYGRLYGLNVWILKNSDAEDLKRVFGAIVKG